MKSKLGITFVIIGSVLIAAALGLLLYNEQEERQAVESTAVLMPQVIEAINERQAEHIAEEDPAPLPLDPAQPVESEKEMTVVDIEGYGYIGFVGIPALNLELPVMADWSYPQLKIAPCRYTGSIYSDDLVLMAHNYRIHFGGLSDLRVGDSVTFTDMDAQTITYEVVALDVLAPTAIEEMTAGEYDLTLFTCTYGGQSRVTVRCNRIEE